jgi:hypothetical protein
MPPPDERVRRKKPEKTSSLVKAIMVCAGIGITLLVCCGGCVAFSFIYQYEPAPVDVKFVNGTFEAKDSLRRDPNGPFSRRIFRMPVKADTAYWIVMRGKHGMMTVVMRTFDKTRIEHTKQGEGGTLYYFKKNDTVDYHVEGPERGAEFTVIFREVSDSTALPRTLRIEEAVPPPTPKIQTVAKLDRDPIAAGVFAHDGKSFWGADLEGTLTQWAIPDAAVLRRFDGQKNRAFYTMGTDAKNNLYVQFGPFHDKNKGRVAPPGDISVFDEASVKAESAPLPPVPTKTIPLNGVVSRFITSPNGRSVYVLDTPNRRLSRIDSDKLAIDKTLALQSTDPSAFCLTPNGKKIYVCAESNRIEIVDAESFTLERTVKISPCRPKTIAANDEGIVALGGELVQTPQNDFLSAYLVDTRIKDTETLTAIVTEMRLTNSQDLQFSSDQKAVLFFGQASVATCGLPSQLVLYKVTHAYSLSGQSQLRGMGWLSPNRRHAVRDKGVVISVGP